MRSGFFAACAALALLGCSPAAAPAPPPADAASSAPDPGVRAHAGDYYSDFIRRPGLLRYAPDRLGLTAEGLKRFEDAMQVESPAPLAHGGGAEALVFEGCRAHACPDAVAVLAVDAASGAVFVGVRDEKGEDVLIANDRLEALLDATSPTQRWSDPLSWQGPLPASPDATAATAP